MLICLQYGSRGTLLVTDIHLQVRAHQQAKLVKKLKAIQRGDRHIFPGTVARYVVKGDAALTNAQIVLVWKPTEMPDEATRRQDLAAFQMEALVRKSDTISCRSIVGQKPAFPIPRVAAEHSVLQSD